MIELCTGDPNTEEDLKKILDEHPEFNENIFSEDLEKIITKGKNDG